MNNVLLIDIAKDLLSHDNMLILTHKSPDGDTLGSSFSLCMALRQLGKKVNILTEKTPKQYSYLFDNYEDMDIIPEYIISVDVASPKLFSDNMTEYIDKIDVKIDHHEFSNVEGRLNYCDPGAPAVGEIMYDLVKLLGVPFDEKIASGIYTAIATDTGCFKYINTTPKTHEVAKEMMPLCDFYEINRINFQVKTKARVKLEALAANSIEFYFDNKLAIMDISLEMKEKAGSIGDAELEGMVSIPNEIEGVLMGLTIKEQGEKEFKVSARTDSDIDASAFCVKFGGGGHKGAAGCTIFEDYETVKNMLIKEAEKFLS